MLIKKFLNLLDSKEQRLKDEWNKYLKDGSPRRYNFKGLFSAYNDFFNKNEQNPLCGSCIARVVKNTRRWLKETN